MSQPQPQQPSTDKSSIKVPELLVTAWEAACREDLAFFCEYTSKGLWKAAKHHKALCEKLELVAQGKIKRLLVRMPPRHGKSEIISRYFPAWFLGNNPNEEIILTSYGEKLTFDFSRAARAVFEEWGHRLWGHALSRDSASVARWEVANHRGGLTAAGVGGPITGRGARIAIIDDPIKNYEEAFSKHVRDQIWKWYQSTLRTRLTPNGAIIVVMTTWHDDDLSGKLLEEMSSGGDQWVTLTFPAIAVEEDALGRDIGDPLWPEHGFDKEWAEETQKAVGSYIWGALYQQSPSQGDQKFKIERITLITQPPVDVTARVRYWDKAGTTDAGKYTSGVKMSIDRFKRVYVEDVQRFRLSALARNQRILQTAQLDRTMHGRPITIYLEQEPGSGGKESAEISVSELVGHPVFADKVTGQKEVRALPFEAQVEGGNVFLVQGLWNRPYLDELEQFPVGPYSDQTDASSGGFNKLALHATRRWVPV